MSEKPQYSYGFSVHYQLLKNKHFPDYENSQTYYHITYQLYTFEYSKHPLCEKVCTISKSRFTFQLLFVSR